MTATQKNKKTKNIEISFENLTAQLLTLIDRPELSVCACGKEGPDPIIPQVEAAPTLKDNSNSSLIVGPGTHCWSLRGKEFLFARTTHTHTAHTKKKEKEKEKERPLHRVLLATSPRNQRTVAVMARLLTDRQGCFLAFKVPGASSMEKHI